MHCNPRLASFLDEILGHGYHHDAAELETLLDVKESSLVKKELESIKTHNKRKLQRYLQAHQGVTVNPDSIFDIQIKRMHEYKRQQMNVLYVIYKYLDIKAGNIPTRPLTVFFGGKAAPAYTTAQDIIHLILVLSQVIQNDPDVAPHLQVVMIENYNVTEASYIIPAADISEQISLASKEASGTGNMKFMLTKYTNYQYNSLRFYVPSLGTKSQQYLRLLLKKSKICHVSGAGFGTEDGT
jgi:starch phosphorylase